MDMLEKFLTFAEQSPTAFHSTAHFTKMLREKGYRELREVDPWLVDAGGRYFVTRNESSVIAFCVPESGFNPFRIVAAHGDSPAFKLKPGFEDRTSEGYTRLNVEKYGGMIMSSWMDRPLAVAGRLVIRDGDGIASRLVNLDRDAELIPNMPIHFNREVNDGYHFDPQKDMMPLYAWGDGNEPLMKEIAESAGVQAEDVIAHDLFLYSRQSGSVWGAGDAFFSCQRIDDLECAWAGMAALLESQARETINVCAVFDNEEVGSTTRQGANSSFLYDTLTRAGFALGASDGEIRAAVAGSIMVSADNAHAVHPNHPEKYDGRGVLRAVPAGMRKGRRASAALCQPQRYPRGIDPGKHLQHPCVHGDGGYRAGAAGNALGLRDGGSEGSGIPDPGADRVLDGISGCFSGPGEKAGFIRRNSQRPGVFH